MDLKFARGLAAMALSFAAAAASAGDGADGIICALRSSCRPTAALRDNRALTPPRPMPSSDSSPALDPALVAPLEPGENALASLDVDLDSADRFAAGRLMLTDRRLLAHAPGAAGWQAWPLAGGLNLQHTDHGGIGQILGPVADLDRDAFVFQALARAGCGREGYAPSNGAFPAPYSSA